MEGIRRVAEALPSPLGEAVLARSGELREVRLRAGQRPALRGPEGWEWIGDPLGPAELREVAAALMDFSVYAREEELREGFFTLKGGFRVGVTGRYALRDGRLGELVALQALCIRFAREVRGAADPLMERVLRGEVVRSLAVISRPGMGKTTCLRDLARQLSERGFSVALADERGELAALLGGVPTLDVGPCTDVMELCPKAIAMRHMLRSMAPEVIVTDELGGEGDAEAVLEARRSGVAVVASIHGESIPGAFSRPALRNCGDAFDLAALLEGAPGRVAEIRERKGALSGWGEGS